MSRALVRKLFCRRLQAREVRLLILLSVLAGIAAWKLVPRLWHPTRKLESPHYLVSSTATAWQTEETARALEALHAAYSNRVHRLAGFRLEHPPLRVKLFKDREEFRRINPGLGWAEAFYRKPFCRAYYSASENNPVHWVLHEAVHQLNQEVAGLDLAKWLEEGSAEYFSTSRQSPEGLLLGRVDPDTYPVWWIDQLATAPELEDNLRNGSVIPLRQIITNRGGPRLGSHVNLYYLHWWTLTHFLFATTNPQDQATLLLERGGTLPAFEELIGPVETVQREWHRHVRRLKAALDKPTPDFWKTGVLPPETNGPPGR